MKVSVLCEICFSKIAIADTDTLYLPLTGTMFSSPDPFHEVPAPFPPSANWEFMRCPMGNHRPFIRPDLIPFDVGVARSPSFFAVLSPDQNFVVEQKALADRVCPFKVEPEPVKRKPGRPKSKTAREKIMEDSDASG
jgi:hypothetical protein